MAKKTTSVYIEEETLKKVDSVAKKEDRTRNQILRKIIENGVSVAEKKGVDFAKKID